MELLGVEWPPTKGWTSRLIGSEISDENVTLLLALKNKHLEPPHTRVLEESSELDLLTRKSQLHHKLGLLTQELIEVERQLIACTPDPESTRQT